ncbi:MAG: hypothetical protein K2N14_01765 [Clostridia bacterium]|nr:hypothetical protein [Clostridia bacterium]
MAGLVAGYLGPEGTYSSIAAHTLLPDANAVAYPSFFALFNALESGEVDRIVLPIENTLNGAVTQNLDLLQERQNVYAEKSCRVKVDHRLITLDGTQVSSVKHIYSHPQALAQCAKYLAENFPLARLHETASTADCINMIVNEECAGIVGAHCKRSGFTLSANSISDEENNCTQFLLVNKGCVPQDTKSDRIFFTVTCQHRTGALVELLNLLRERGINMTKIESRPIKKMAGQFRFFIETEGNYASPKVKDALITLEQASLSFKLLGCYFN